MPRRDPDVDYGSNNSDYSSTSSEETRQEIDELKREQLRREFPEWYLPALRGVPKQCYCARPMVVKAQNTGPETGRMLLECEGFQYEGRHYHRWFDEAMAEELEECKNDIGRCMYEIQHITSNTIGCYVDPHMMWDIVYRSREKVKTLKEETERRGKDIDELKEGIKKRDEEIDELKESLGRRNKDIDELKETVGKLETMFLQLFD